jgi:hypothetical protein
MKVRRHFSPRPAIPQAVVQDAGIGHKGRGSALRCLEFRLLLLDFRRALAAGVGKREVSVKDATGAANHPQSLWISLWMVSGLESQVTYRKGFFFGRSKFERRNLARIIMRLPNFCPLRPNGISTVTIRFQPA